MRSSLDFLRALIISPEFLVLVAVAVSFPWLADAFAQVASKFSGASLRTSDIVVWAGLAPTLVMVPLALRILFPKEENKSLLQAPFYPRLKLRVYLGVFWCSSSGLTTVVLSLVDFPASSTVGAVYVGATAAGYVAAATMLLAGITLRELVERESQDPPDELPGGS